MQSRVMSSVESVTNVCVGYVVALIATWLILPAFGLDANISQAVGISAAFTIISLIRSYALRRFFNSLRT
jgi:uncharacterized membrane protein